MRHQTGIGGGLIHVEPNVLVVPAELETVGEQLIAEIKPIQVAEVNPSRKLVKMVVEPRLPAYGPYLVAEPSMVDGLEFAYLARSPGPQLESRLGFEVDGLQVRVRLATSAARSSTGVDGITTLDIDRARSRNTAGPAHSALHRLQQRR